MTRKDVVAGLAVFAALSALVAAVALGVSDGEAWLKFRIEHHCQEVDRQNPPAGIAVAPGKVTWVCDDGKVYVRNDD
jgi:hypothetical protein